MKTSLIAVLTCAAAMAQTPATKAPAPAATATTAPKAAPKAAAPGGPNLLDPNTMKAMAPAVFNVKLTTTKGEVMIQVTRAWAPNGADRFYNLVRAGFYTNAAFFRVLPGFMAQIGISARPEVTKVWDNRNIPDDRVTQSNTRGKVTFAQTSAPNSRSTQIFINYGNNSFLDSMRFAPFGEVTSGMEVMDNINSEYKETPDQGQITDQGRAYLDRNFPRLDKILTATIVPVAPAAPAAAPAAPSADTKK
jgi:peptidyl-prolyl cis-trans isomerase A (cyclophilin A)